MWKTDVYENLCVSRTVKMSYYYVMFRYVWKKDGEELDTSSEQSKYVIEPPGGSITIKRPSAEDDGVYQCFARNEFGIAVSIKTTVKRAGLSPLINMCFDIS